MTVKEGLTLPQDNHTKITPIFGQAIRRAQMLEFSLATTGPRKKLCRDYQGCHDLEESSPSDSCAIFCDISKPSRQTGF
ncbi:uncharacterized protein RSE6_03202 [Rhynchosporium secalis]|uniref:Uncharacterized protein n=1 Tax=Rhynchosporium secalis TaxID=38038 RepID=A0A1E1M258_RHYSE|nr:uncharacterized protein RSE6_03202 [Rhynchosporium secalis]